MCRVWRGERKIAAEDCAPWGMIDKEGEGDGLDLGFRFRTNEQTNKPTNEQTNKRTNKANKL